MKIEAIMLGASLGILLANLIVLMSVRREIRACRVLQDRCAAYAAFAYLQATRYREAMALAQYGAVEEAIALCDEIRKAEVPP